jgi:hypothetical protein
MRVLARFGFAPLMALLASLALAEPPRVSPFGAPKLPPLSASSKLLISTSDGIAVGRVVSIAMGKFDGEVARFARFQVTESWKGGLSGEIEIVLPGGIDPDVKIVGEVAHDSVPPFAPEEEAAVFLVALSGRDRSYAVAGGLGGKILLRRGDDDRLWAARLLDSRGKAPIAQLREQIQIGITESSGSASVNENTSSNS